MTGYRSDIDGLRALAIVPVVLYHLGFAGFSGGYVGVDVFFVISGFLITSIIHPEIVAGQFSFARFYERRIRRLFPALFAVLLCSLAAAAVILMPEDFKGYAKSMAAATLFSANLFFWRSAGYFDGPAETKPLLHTWSLSVEEQFYIFYPVLLLWLASRAAPAARGRWLAGAGMISFLISVAAVPRWPEAAFYLPPHRAWELLLGAWLALGGGRALASRTGATILAGAGLALIAYSVHVYTPATPFPGLNALAPAVGAGLVILAGQHGPHRLGHLIGARPLVLIGLMSYSLYLWHWPVIVFSRYLLMREPTDPERLAILVVSLLLAGLSWRYIERPFRGKSGQFGRRRLFAAAGLVMAALVAIGLAGDWRQGFPDRFSPEVVALAAVAEETSPYRKPCMTGKPDRSESAPACRLGPAGAPPRFLLWGDSHALALAPGLAAAAGQTGMPGLFIGKNGCPPLLGVERLDSPHGCRAYNDRVRDWLTGHPNIDTVILAGRWSLAANGERNRIEGKKPVVISTEGLAGNPAAFAAGLQQTLAFLEKRGTRILLVKQTPEIGWPVASNLAIARQFGLALPAAPTAADHRQRQTTVDTLFARTALSPAVTLFDPAEQLCPDGACRVVAQGQPLYSDDNHLSRFGALELAPRLAQLLAAPASPKASR